MSDEPWPEGTEDRVRRLVHDLRTPLTIVAGFAELLQRQPDLDPVRREEFVARITAAAGEMKKILDDARADRRDEPPPPR